MVAGFRRGRLWRFSSIFRGAQDSAVPDTGRADAAYGDSFAIVNIGDGVGAGAPLCSRHSLGEIVMPDAQTAAMLRAVLEELCVSISPFDAHTRTNVASKLLETIRNGRSSLDDLKNAGRQALYAPPTMWR